MKGDSFGAKLYTDHKVVQIFLCAELFFCVGKSGKLRAYFQQATLSLLNFKEHPC